MNDKSVQTPQVSAQCPSCGVSRNPGGRCDYCGAVYTDGFDLGPPDITARALDKKYNVIQQGRLVEITWSWRRPILWLLIPCSVIWVYCCVITIVIVFRMPMPTPGYPYVFPVIFFLLGVGLVFITAVLFFNSTTLGASPSALFLRHHPVRCRGAIQFDAKDISQLRVTRKEKSANKQVWEIVALEVVTTSGSTHDLLVGSPDNDASDFDTVRCHLSVALGHEYY